MSRRPDYTLKPSEKSAWAPPAWLLPDQPTATALDGSNNRRNMSHYYLSVPIPPVPPAVRKAIEAKVAESSDYSQEKNQKNYLTTKLCEQRLRVDELRNKITYLEAQKEQGLDDIRSARNEKTNKLLEKIEADLRQQFYNERRKRKEAMEKSLREEHDARRKRRRDQYKKEDDEAALERQKSEANLIDLVEASASVQALRKEASEKSDHISRLKSKLESLQETRSEIVWLLKQVIKAEEKNKMKKDTTKSPPLTTVSKQA